MAKVPQDNGKEIKDMLQKLFKAVQVMSSASEEQKRISKELMKVMSLLNSGFVESADDANKLINTIKDNGFSLTDEFIKKWARARKATDEDLKNIVKRFHEIDDLSDDVIDSAKDYTDLLEDQIDSLEDGVDLSTKLLRNHKKIEEALLASKKQAMALGSSTQDVNDITSKLLQKKINLTGMFDGMFGGLETGTILLDDIKSDISSLVQKAQDSEIEIDFRFNPLTGDLDKEIKKSLDSIDEERTKRLQGLQDYYAKNTELQDKLAKQMASQNFTSDIKFDVNTSDISNSTGVLQKGTADYQNAIDQLNKVISENSINEIVDSNLKEMVSLLGSGVELTEEQNNKIIKYRNLLDDSNKIMFKEFDTRLKDLNVLKQSIIKEKSRLTVVGKYTDQLIAARGVVEKIGEGFDYLNDIMPSGVSDFLGISKVSLLLLEAHKKGVEKFSQHIEEGGELTKAMGVYMSEMGPSIRAALSPMTLLVAAGALLFQTLRTSVEVYKDMASEMKISILQAKQLHEVQLDILTSQKNQFTTMQDIHDIQSEMIDSGKSLNMLNTKETKELAIGLSEVGKAFGYGSQQAAKLQNIFTDLGADNTIALNLQTSLGFATELAGLSPQIINQDLIDGSEEVYTYFAGMPDKAANAALQVRRMGMSLKQAGSIAQKMLDLEGFMTDMYELQAMTSGGIDFSRAFDKGLVGDIEGMTKEIMNQIGTTAEYNKMDFLTRTKIAKTLGMSADELGKSVKLNEQLAQFSGMEKSALEDNINRLGDISKLDKDQIRDRLQQLQSTDRLGVAWDKIKGVLLKALIPLAETFADAIDAISPIIDIIVGALKGVGLIMKIITPLVKGMLAPFKFIGDILSKVTSYLDESSSNASVFGSIIRGIGTTLDKIGEYAYYIGAAIGTWALLFKMPAVIGSVAGTFKTILSFIPGVGTLLGSLTNGLGGIFGSMGKKSKDAAKESTDPVVNMTTKIQESMTGMVSSIKSSMDGMVDHIKESMSNAAAVMSKSFTKSPTQKLMEKVKKEGIETTTSLSTETEKATKSMKKSMEDGSNVSKKKLKEIKEEGSNLISKTGIKDSFKMLGEVGTRAMAAMAAKSITSFLFAQKEGEQKLSGTSEHIQGVIEMAAMGGSQFLIGTLQDSVEKAFSKRFEKKIEGGFGKITEKLSGKLGKVGESGGSIFGKITGKLNKGFDDMGSKGTGIFSKIGEYGKSIFGKLTSFGKSKLPEAGKSLVDSFDEVGEKLNPVTKITETVEKKIKEKITGSTTDKSTTTKLDPVKVEVPKDTKKSIGSMTSIFEKSAKVIKEAWNGLKSILLDIVKFAGNVLKTITEALGKSIENLLKGIGKGLSSFKTNAVKGAAALVLVSGALWITSKALENFANVSWESVGKGLLTLGALTLAAMAIGKASGEILIGAAAIALLGASLIPAAYALNMFNAVDWSALGKAGVALLGLGVIGTLMSVVAPEMIIGAVALGVFSAALIVTGIALDKFNDIEWSALGKAGVALLGLAVAGAAMGPLAPVMLMGAIGIAALGAAMIPMAYAMKMFNDVDWDSLGKAGVALAGFGVIAAGFGLAAPLILAGALTIGVASISLFAFAGSVLAIGVAVKNLEIKPLNNLADSLLNLTNISATSLFEVSAGIAAITASMAGLSIVGVGSSIAKFFGGDAIKDLERLANLANPLDMVNETLEKLSASILELSDVVNNANFDNIKKLNDIDVKSLDQEINQRINTIGPETQIQSQPSVNYKVSPQQTQEAQALTPKKETVAQNVKVNVVPGTGQSKEEGSEESNVVNNYRNSTYSENSPDSDIYSRPNSGMKKIEMLLLRLIHLQELSLQKSADIHLDSQKVGTVLKKNNNNK